MIAALLATVGCGATERGAGGGAREDAGGAAGEGPIGPIGGSPEKPVPQPTPGDISERAFNVKAHVQLVDSTLDASEEACLDFAFTARFRKGDSGWVFQVASEHELSEASIGETKQGYAAVAPAGSDYEGATVLSFSGACGRRLELDQLDLRQAQPTRRASSKPSLLTVEVTSSPRAVTARSTTRCSSSSPRPRTRTPLS